MSREKKNKNYPLYQKKDKANGDEIKQVVFVNGELECDQNKISSRQFANTNTLRKSVGCGLHRSIGLLKRDDSNSPQLISDKKRSHATNEPGNDNGNFLMFSRSFLPVFSRYEQPRHFTVFYTIFSRFFSAVFCMIT